MKFNPFIAGLCVLLLTSCATDKSMTVSSVYPSTRMSSSRMGINKPTDIKSAKDDKAEADPTLAPPPDAAPAAPVEMAAVPAPQAEAVAASPAEINNQGPSEQISGSYDEAAKAPARRPVEGIFVGRGAQPPKKQKGANEVAAADSTTLNFINADINDVAKAVLGDMLGLNYVVSPLVKGLITIKTNAPLPKEALLPTLNTAFRINGAAIVESQGVVKVVPVTDAIRSASPITAGRTGDERGFGLQAVVLRYVTTDEMRKILEPVAPQGGVVPIDSAHNVMLLAGTDDERAAMLDVINTFDMDWLSGMSFGLFTLKEANAKVVIGELWEVLGTTNGPLAKMIKLVPLDRLNAVLAISTQPKYLQEVKKWIERLDFDKAPADQKIWVYAVQNGRAVALSETLEKLIAERNSGKAAVAFETSPGVAPLLPAGVTGDASQPPSPATPGMESLGSGAPSAAKSRIIADESTNSLIIMATKSEFELIESTLKKLDVVPLQVRIEAVIAEVTLTDDLRYGVQYLFHKHNAEAILTTAKTLTVSPTVPGFSAFVTGSHISAVLDLLQSRTTLNVISSPQLMVLNNQTALLQIGDQVPIAAQQAVSVLTPGAPVVNSIQLKDTGVILKVTPRVNASGMVMMDISQEVSDVAKTTSSTLDSPTIQQRKISSSVAVRDGETIALGGLIKDNVTTSRDGIPLLSDIPYLGSLFSTSLDSSTRTELLVLITPRVVRNDSDIRVVTEEMRQQMHAVIPLSEKIH